MLINTEIPNQRPPWIPFYQKLLAMPGTIHALQGLLRLRAFRHSGAGFGGCFLDPALIDGDFTERFIRPLIREHRRSVGYARFLRGFDWAENDALSALHERITCPVSFIWGRQDRTFPYEHALAMAAQFPNFVGFAAIHQARLLPHEEQPDAVSTALRRFLDH